MIRLVKLKNLMWSGYVGRFGEIRNANSILVGKPQEKRQLGRRRRRWEDNIRIDLRDIRWETVDWILLAQGKEQLWASVSTVMRLSIKCGEFLDCLSDYYLLKKDCASWNQLVNSC
jgi:hypothetical protein